MRQRTGAVVCPNCGRLVDVREEKCPYCGQWRPGMFGYATPIARFLGGRLDLGTGIIGVTAALYVVSLALDPGAAFGGGLMNLLSPGSRALYQLGMTGGVAWDLRWWWTLLTATFLHGSLLHILFNMFAVQRYLPLVADLFGNARAFSLYLLSGVGGFLLSNLVTGNPTIGASCSIFGLLAALIVYGRRTGQMAVTAQLGQLAFVMFLFGFFMPNVNNWGHAGGFVGGYLAAEVMMASVQKREGPAELLLAGALLLATAAGFVLSFVKVTTILMGG
jgi:rhomboid protease GluP